MTDETGAPATEQPAAPATDAGGELTLEQARMMIEGGNVTEHFEGDEPEREDDDAPAKPERNSSPEDDAARPEKAATGETEEEAPAEKPSRDLPRSWSKDKAEYWSKLDPAVQDYLLEQDSKVSAEVRRAQNEAAEVRKTIEAEKKAIETERERYLRVASSDIEAKEAALAQRFPHIKTMDDVTFLASEALRLANSPNPDDQVQSQQVQAYINAWRIAQDDLAVTRAQKVEAERRHETEHSSKWSQFVQEETKAFAESLPAADKAKLDAWNKAAPDFLINKGFKPEELTALANGKEKLAIHDRRMQSILLDALKYQELKNAPKAVAKPNLPPVQKPGTAAGPGAAVEATIRDLTRKLDQTGSVDDAWALYQARQRAS